MQNHTNASPTIYNQVRNVLLLGIVITLLLSLVASFLLNLMSENRSRDQTLESSAQVAANMPLLTEDLYAPETTEYIRRTVQNVPSIDVFAVYDREGTPIAFYDLATGQDDATALASLSQDIVDWFLAGNATLIYNGEAPAGADRCAYAAIYADDGTLIGYAMTGIYIRSIRATMVRMVLFHLLAGVAAWAAGSFLSLRLSRKIKDNLLGYEPDAFRRLFLQRMDILDSLEEGLLAIDEDQRVTYLNRAASEILQIDQSGALGQLLKDVYPHSTIPRVMQTGKPEYQHQPGVHHPRLRPSPTRIPVWREGKIEGAVPSSATAPRSPSWPRTSPGSSTSWRPCGPTPTSSPTSST